MSIPHPIPYQGSKRNLAKAIMAFFPNTAFRLVEPFVGSGALSIASAYHRRAERFLLNDVNQPLMALWENMLSNPLGLASQYDLLWHQQLGQEKNFYNLVRQEFNVTHQPHFLLYLLARCVKASIRYNAKGEFNQSPDNRRRGRLPSAMAHDLEAVYALLGGKTVCYAEDYRTVLKQVTPNDVVYLDPPYVGLLNRGADGRYLEQIALDELAETLDQLNHRGIFYLLSYDGRTGDKVYQHQFPSSLKLMHISLPAGRSSQATLLGRNEQTVESLYLSPNLGIALGLSSIRTVTQLALWEGLE